MVKLNALSYLKCYKDQWMVLAQTGAFLFIVKVMIGVSTYHLIDIESCGLHLIGIAFITSVAIKSSKPSTYPRHKPFS